MAVELGLPLALFHEYLPCSECGRDIVLLTDGIKAVAESGYAWSDRGVVREGLQITVYCGAPSLGDRETPCEGEVTFDLSTWSWVPAANFMATWSTAKKIGEEQDRG